MSEPVEAVLFDIDDTLVDSRVAFAAGIDAVCSEFLPHLNPDRYADALTLWRTDPDGYYRRYTRGELDFDVQRMYRANQIQETFGGAALDEDAYQRWAGLFMTEFERAWAPFEDSAAVVDGLLAAGIRVGAVSNASNDVQTRKLAATGLGESVPLLIGMDTLGFGKPDPRVWLEACRLLDVDPARTAYVGDELDLDGVGARAAGLVGVWLDRPGSRRGGRYLEDPEFARERGVVVISGLHELGPALGLGLQVG